MTLILPYPYTDSLRKANDNLIALDGELDGNIGDDNLESPPWHREHIAEQGFDIPGGQAGGTYWITERGGLNAGGAAGAIGPSQFPIFGSGYVVPGKTAYLQVILSTLTNNTSPAITLSAGIGRITASAGGAGVISLTQAGYSVSVQYALVANQVNRQGGAVVTFPVDGNYAWLLVLSGATAANSFTAGKIQLTLLYA